MRLPAPRGPWPEVILAPMRAVKLGLTRAYSRARVRVTGVPYQQLVVCGYPRGGTSLIYNMLSATLSGFRFEAFERPVIHRIHRLGNVASKYPLDLFNLARLPDLNVHDKRVSVIIMIRDPRDVVTSRHPMLPDRYFIGHDHSWWPQDRDFREWKYDAPGVLEIHAEIETLRDSPRAPLIVRYEDLVDDPDDIQGRIEADFGLKFGGRFSDFHEREDKLAYSYEGRMEAKDPSLIRENRPVDRTRAGKWRSAAHRGRIQEQFESCPALFEIVKSYGYEADDTWYDPYAG